MFLDHRSIFDTIMMDQVLNFHEIVNFFSLQAYVSKTVNRSDINLAPAYLPPVPYQLSKYVVEGRDHKSTDI